MTHNSRFLSIFAVFAVAIGLSASARAQSASFQNSVVHVQHDPPSMGRDYWLALLTNYGNDLGGKYFALYISSPNATTVHVQLSGGLTKTINVQPFKTASFNIPLAWEMRSSGRVEDMAIHVWSDDADITCSVMCHNAYTSDGMSIIPPIGWGTDYVVAGYKSIFEGGGTYVYDLPSEFLVVANQDSTKVMITPSADLRVEASPGANCSGIFAQKGVPTQVILNKGQVIQLKTTCTQDCDNFDVTGTRISSSNPVGVIAGSMCPNIPCDFPYCDHVCEMIPPMRTWSQTYYTIPFFQPPGSAESHSASTFLVMPSMPLQKIYRMDSTGVPTLYCLTDSVMSPYWRNDVAEASKWFSAEPFLLVQYINSASYPDNVNGQGDPAEVVISGEEQFFRTSVFQIPVSIGNSNPFTNYVNVLADASDKNVLLDGKRLQKPIALDGRYVGYRVPNLATGSHVVTSDSGAGVYEYGYGYDESYAYSGPMGTATLNSPDTLPIGPNISSNGTEAMITMNDPVKNGGIYFIRPDSLVNVAIRMDPNYIEGRPANSASYSLSVLDFSKAGSATVSAFTTGGSRTTITTNFDPGKFGAYLTPSVQNVSVFQGLTAYLYDTIVNTNENHVAMTNLTLKYGDRGFSIDSVDRTTLEGIGRRVVRIKYQPTNMANSTDTLMLGSITAALNGSMITNAGVNDGKNGQAVAVTVEGRSLKTSLDESAHIDLITTAGVTALSADISPKGELNVGSLAAGAYFYRLAYSGKTLTGKIVIP